MTYPLHPLCTLFPRIEGRAFDDLVADIAANGLREPIIIHDGMVLDGGNRQRACQAAGIEPTYTPFDGPSIAGYVLSKNLHRRHLTEGQRAAIVASTTDWARAHGQGQPKKPATLPVTSGNEKPATLPLDTQAGRAAAAGTSIRTQRMADFLAKNAPDKLAQVTRGEKSLPEAVKEAAPLPKRYVAQEQAFGQTSKADLMDELKADLDRQSARIIELEAAIRQKDEQISKLTGDNVASALAKEIQLRQGIEGRLAFEQNKVHKLQAELDSYARFYAELRKATGQEARSAIVSTVQRLRKEQEGAL